MFNYILWRFLILETFVLGALCCPCVDEHPQKLFCMSEFVVNVKIHTEVKVATYQVFMMEIKKVFKGDVRELSLIDNRYGLLVIFMTCRDPFMGKRDTSIIFGHSMSGNIIVSPTICQRSKSWWRASPFIQHALSADYYKDNCDCSPEISIDANDTSNQNFCKWVHSYMRRSGEKCNWDNNTSFRSCLGYEFYAPV